ncbi:hypothetical protein DFH09DRAFT_1364348 [Mycena vulgaris]|nr:hypothetical protein DFH09DRAFT_1364348 [Mycena vulgaris]
MVEPRHHRSYESFRLSPLVVGPGYHRHEYGHILGHSQHQRANLISTLSTSAVSVRSVNARLDFERITCHQYLPDLPLDEYEAQGFTIPNNIDPRRSVGSYLVPPSTRESAISAVTSTSTSTQHSISASFSVSPDDGDGRSPTPDSPICPIRRFCRVEVFIDANASDFFCAVFLTEAGVYEVARVFSIANVISQQSLIFAPSAWKHSATVIASAGAASDSLTRLVCRLESDDIVLLDVDTSLVGVPDGWVADGYHWFLAASQ